jgi:hypothetical protein
MSVKRTKRPKCKMHQSEMDLIHNFVILFCSQKTHVLKPLAIENLRKMRDPNRANLWCTHSLSVSVTLFYSYFGNFVNGGWPKFQASKILEVIAFSRCTLYWITWNVRWKNHDWNRIYYGWTHNSSCWWLFTIIYLLLLYNILISPWRDDHTVLTFTARKVVVAIAFSRWKSILHNLESGMLQP